MDQSSLSDYTILSMISFIVDASINLYDQCDRVTANIRDVPSDLMLPTKLGPIQLPVAEMVPKNLLGLSLGLSQPPSNPVPYQGLGGPLGHYCALIYRLTLSPLPMGEGPGVRV